METTTQTTQTTEDGKGKKIIGYIGFGIMVLFLSVAGLCAAYDNITGPSLEKLELAYKNAYALHESAVTQEILASKNECSALATLAAAKLLAATKGELKVNNAEDLAKKASADCFTMAK